MSVMYNTKKPANIDRHRRVTRKRKEIAEQQRWAHIQWKKWTAELEGQGIKPIFLDEGVSYERFSTPEIRHDYYPPKKSKWRFW